MSLLRRTRSFPLPYSVGTDICHIPRVAALLKKDKGKFAVKLLKKVLNTSEQKWYSQKMFTGIAIADRLGGIKNPRWEGFIWTPLEPPTVDLDPKDELDRREVQAYLSSDDKERARNWETDLASRWRNMSEETLDKNLNNLATWLAGRWAAKEAVIKAHTWRRLTMHDITIYSPRVRMGRTVAPKATVLAINQSWKELQQEKEERKQGDSFASVDIVVKEDLQPKQEEAELQGRRYLPVEQEVKISISHDGDYATAICLAARERPSNIRQPREQMDQT